MKRCEKHQDDFEEYARELLLSHAGDVLHALGCTGCGLQEEATFILAMVGWDTAAFVRACLERGVYPGA